MNSKKFVNKQTQTNKEIIKNVVIVDRIIAMNYNKICEIPNYAKIIEDHLEYYKELMSMRATEND